MTNFTKLKEEGEIRVMVSKEKMHEEATKRLETLQTIGLCDEVAKLWKEKGEPCVAFRDHETGNLGTNFVFSEKPELNEIKNDFEKNYDCMVYYGIFTETQFGNYLSLFYVSDTKSDWRYEKSGMKKGYASVYAWNIEGKFGEFGSIGFIEIGGGLVRCA